MALEDLDLKINVGLLNAESSLSTIGKIDAGIVHAGHVAHVAASSLSTLGSTMSMVGGTTQAIGGIFTTSSNSVLHFVHSLHAAYITIDLLTTEFAMLMVPLRLIGAASVAVFNLMNAALNTVLLPVKLLWAGLSMIAKVTWDVVGTLAGLDAAVFKVWFLFKGWIGALKTLWGWFGMLPPKLRLIVGGLLVLGAAGKAGSFALGVLAGAARMAATAFQLLSLPVLTLVNPMRALTVAANLAGRAVLYAGSMASKAAGGMYSFGKSVASSVGSVSASIAGTLVSAVRTGITTLAALGAAASAWGVKMAVKAETATVVFGTMLKDMKAGKALMNELENWSGAPLFDPEAIQLSGTLLFKAGIAAQDITGKLDQLGNIAAATKTPLEDLARVYQQGMNQGSFQQDKINQLSDRGIAIYEGLTAATGASGQALKDMISDGKIGPAEMNSAIEHLTTGTGIYAGAMTNLGQTTGGMWSALVNKAGLAARELGNNLLIAFDAKGMMASATEFFGNLRSHIANALPVFKSIVTAIKAAFSAVWEIVTVAFNSVSDAIGTTGGDWQASFVKFAAIATWAFENWPDIAIYAMTSVQITISTIFSNLISNIKSSMDSLWKYIKSAGRTKLEFTFDPVKGLEEKIAKGTGGLGEKLATSLTDKIDFDLKKLEDFRTEQANFVAPTLDGAHAPGATHGDENSIAAASKAAENKAIATRSQEGQSVVSQFLQGFIKNDTAKTQTQAAVAAAKSLANIERDTRKGKTLVTRRLA